MLKFIKITILAILTILILIIGELILSYKCETYKSWKKVQTWNSRIKGLEFSKTPETDHWHLTRNDNKEKGILDLYNTLDFVSDSIAILGKNIMESEGFIGIYNNNKIQFNDPDLKASFKYTSLSNDELKITNVDHGEFIASKCDAKCCDHQLHYFYPNKVYLDLPIISQDEKYDERIERSLEFSIYIGMSKDDIQKNLEANYKIAVFDEFRNFNELNLIEEEFRLKVPDIKTRRIYRVIYADKNTPIKLLEELINHLKIGNKKKIFLALRNEDSTNKINIYLKSIHQFKINDELVLEEWLKK